MRNKMLRQRFWLVLLWRSIVRATIRTPKGHPLRPYLQAAGMAVEDHYWRQTRMRRRPRS